MAKTSARRGWNTLSAAERKRWKASKAMAARQLTTEVAEAIVSLIASGEAAKAPAVERLGGYVPPQNIIYGTLYTGVQAVSLAAQAKKRNQYDCRFLTARALSRLKDRDGNTARLRPGAKPYVVMAPRRARSRPLEPGEDTQRYEQEDRLERRPDGRLWVRGKLFFAAIHVYSVADTTADVPSLTPVPASAFVENEFLDRMVAACGATVQHDARKTAFYSKRDDVIHMPPRGTYTCPADYYSELCHEFFHWTGAKARENRDMAAYFFESGYAREELRAELFAAIAGVMFGLEGGVLAKSAKYIDSWNQCLKNSPADILAMAAEVQRVAGAIYDIASGLQPGLAWLKDKDFSAVPTPVLDARKNGVSLDDVWRQKLGLGWVPKDSRSADEGASPAEDAPDTELSPAP